MFKKSLAILVLGTAISAPSWADWDLGREYGRVISVEPAVSFNFNDGRSHFRIVYDFGGARYWTYADYRPGPWIAVPPPRYVYRFGDGRYRGPYYWHDHRDRDRWDRDGRRHDDYRGDHRGGWHR
jgi:hypothetical protein